MESRVEKMNRLKNLVYDLGWDYERLSLSGQETYNELCDLLGIE